MTRVSIISLPPHLPPQQSPNSLQYSSLPIYHLRMLTSAFFPGAGGLARTLLAQEVRFAGGTQGICSQPQRGNSSSFHVQPWRLTTNYNISENLPWDEVNPINGRADGQIEPGSSRMSLICWSTTPEAHHDGINKTYHGHQFSLDYQSAGSRIMTSLAFNQVIKTLSYGPHTCINLP